MTHARETCSENQSTLSMGLLSLLTSRGRPDENQTGHEDERSLGVVAWLVSVRLGVMGAGSVRVMLRVVGRVGVRVRERPRAWVGARVRVG